MAKKNKNDFYLYEKDKNLDELDTHNIGMKKPDPSSHSNIAQISETDEVELRKTDLNSRISKIIVTTVIYVFLVFIAIIIIFPF